MWLDANPEIAKEIESIIYKNAADKGVKLVPTINDYFGEIGTKDGKGGLVPYYDFNINDPTDNTPAVWENTEGLEDDDDLPDLVDNEEEKPKEEKPQEKKDPFKFNIKDWISLGSEKLDRESLIHTILESI